MAATRDGVKDFQSVHHNERKHRKCALKKDNTREIYSRVKSANCVNSGIY
jgi:hypothetical protein